MFISILNIFPPIFFYILSEAMGEYCVSIRNIVKYLLGGISESLGLDCLYIENAMNVESSFQLFVTNFYPPCPQSELTMGIPPHTDHGLLTFLISNGVDGLQFKHKGKWRNARAPPGAFIVNIADHIEVGLIKLYIYMVISYTCTYIYIYIYELFRSCNFHKTIFFF